MKLWIYATLRWLPAAASVLALAYMLLVADRGFDFTDESSYLNWISNPWVYPLSVTQYGFVYQPVFEVLGGDIAALRRFNIISTFALGSCFGAVLLSSASRRADLSTLIAHSVPLGFVALLIIANWLATPNYNTLNLQGLLLSATALCLIGNRNKNTSPVSIILPFVLLGCGGWLVFMAKPTSAALLAIVALIYLACVRKFWSPWPLVAPVVAGLLLLGSAFYIDGSVPKFIFRLSDAVAQSAGMDSSYSAGRILRIDPIILSNLDWLVFWSLVGLTALSVILSTARQIVGPLFVAILIACSVLFAGSALVGATSLGLREWSSWHALQVGSVLLGATIASTYFYLRGQLKVPSLSTLATIGLLIVLPYVNAVGTNGNYWQASAYSGIFWVGAAVLLLRATTVGKSDDPRESAVVAIGFVITVYVLSIGLQFPYRQIQPLQRNDQTIRVGQRGAELLVSAQFAQYVNALQELARGNGFTKGTPLIDLTGHYPGAAFVLGGGAVGQAWMIGGYPGSNGLAEASLGRVACAVLATSWLLVEQDGPRSLSKNVLNLHGADYQTLGPIDAPTGSYPQSYEQYLLRPLHDSSMVTEKCLAARISENTR